MLSNELLIESERIWRKLLVKPMYFFNHVDFSEEIIKFMTHDFLIIPVEFAKEVGIDLEKFSKRLAGKNEESFAVIKALQTIFEVEKYYIEIPNACTLYKVPKKFLIVLGAILIGIATSKTSQLDSIIAGTVSGIGSLLINILSERYTSDKNFEVDWLEEFILKVLELNGALTFSELKKKTNIYSKTLRKTINNLEKKELIYKKISWVDKNNTKYNIK